MSPYQLVQNNNFKYPFITVNHRGIFTVGQYMAVADTT